MLEKLSFYNKQQQDIILDSYEHNSVILAGPGAGKTKTVIARIEFLIDEANINPENILAITFTNKAAKEIFDRANRVVNNADKMWIGTYHSICVKLLKLFGEEIGIENFDILKPYDAFKVATSIFEEMDLVADKGVISKYLNKISSLKNDLITPTQYKKKVLDSYNYTEKELEEDFNEYNFITFYQLFQESNFNNSKLDFDDLILYTILLIQSSDYVKEYVANKFKYVLCDEMQDSNKSNIILIRLLAGDNNLFVVGDDDQSIYGWRGARPDFLIHFKDLYDDSNIFKLEQNYRSSKTIVDASNSLIKHNKNRTQKTCFTNNKEGAKIKVIKNLSEIEEAEFLSEEIKKLNKTFSYDYKNIMVLYRTRKQSRVLEEAFIKNNIPYNIIGEKSFSEKKEIKDCLSFLKICINDKDMTSFKRALLFLNHIGTKTAEDLVLFARSVNGIRKALREYKAKNSNVKKSLDYLYTLLKSSENNPYDTLKVVIDMIIMRYKNEGGNLAEERIENLNDLQQMADVRMKQNVELSEFINQVDLITSDVKNTNAVKLLTLHSAKGLESEVVFLVGNCENILPHKHSVHNKNLIEEERRLFYVGMTRAKELLYLSYYTCNSITGKTYSKSRFIKEIPKKYIKEIKRKGGK